VQDMSQKKKREEGGRVRASENEVNEGEVR
jgi:hypothetical protein